MLRIIFTIIFSIILSNLVYSQGYEVNQVNNIPVIVKNDTLKNAWAGGINSSTVSTNDFDQDGVMDILLFDRQNNRNLIFLIKNGKPVFSLKYNNTLPSLFRYGIFYDFNADGKKDLFTSSQAGIKVYKNESIQLETVFKVFKNSLMTNYFGDIINMDISNLDVPALTDVDNDGDMDILHFRSSQGNSVDLEKNMTKELFGKIDSLTFKNLDNCWGGFMENSCKAYNFGFDCKINFRLEHAGAGAVMAFDNDNDADKDLILGKEDCSNFIFLQNQGSISKPIFTKSVFDYPQNSSPTLPYPLPFYEDVDGDNLKDLVVTSGNPNPIDTNESRNNVWFYKNSGSNSSPSFTFQTKNFLQNSMLDAGRNSSPVFMDLNGDGNLDLLISNSASGKNGATIQTYLNTGNSENPIFTQTDTNYLSLEAQGYKDIKYTFADINNDNKKDLVLNYLIDNQLYSVWSENISTLSGYAPSAFKSLNIPLSSLSSLCFYDINNDSFQDLLAGSSNGELNYYKHNGNNLDPSFSLVKSNFGGISVNSNFTNRNLSIDIADINNDKEVDLLIVNDLGKIYYIPSFRNQNQDNFTDIQSFTITQGNLPLGKNLSLSVVELYADKSPHIFLGNNNGGIIHFKVDKIINSLNGNPLKQNKINIYPNPSNGTFTVDSYEDLYFALSDLAGKIICKGVVSRKETLEMQDLLPGLYFFQTESKNGQINSQKLIIK